MNITRAAGAVMCGFLCWAAPAGAMSKTAKDEFAATFGKASPPVGYVEFCARQPEECRSTGAREARLRLTAERWNLLYQVNTYVNGRITPVSDMDLYGEPEHWALPADAGDCEDYLLLKKKYLEGLGFPSESLLITVVLDEKQEGHAVLTVTGDQGDFILDNRRNEILRWNDTGYRFLKRQSSTNPREWLALTRQGNTQPGNLGGDIATNR